MTERMYDSPPRISTPGAFKQWLRNAERGQYARYHRGELCHDREKLMFTRTEGGGLYVRVEPLDSLALLVREAADLGYVALTQKRLGPHDYEYRVTKL